MFCAMSDPQPDSLPDGENPRTILRKLFEKGIVADPSAWEMGTSEWGDSHGIEHDVI